MLCDKRHVFVQFQSETRAVPCETYGPSIIYPIHICPIVGMAIKYNKTKLQTIWYLGNMQCKRTTPYSSQIESNVIKKNKLINRVLQCSMARPRLHRYYWTLQYKWRSPRNSPVVLCHQHSTVAAHQKTDPIWRMGRSCDLFHVL